MITMSNRVTHPCNPLGYVLDRQIDSKNDYCNKLVNSRFASAQNLFRKDLYSHYGCVNAIEFSKEGDMLVSGGDDKRVLVWKVEKAIHEHGNPVVMKAQHMSNIFCLGYNNSKSKIFSAGNDDQVIVHDLQTTDVLNFFRHEKPVYGLSVHPYNDNVFSSACDDGRVLIYDIRESAYSTAENFSCVAQHKNPFHSVMFNPIDPQKLATANAKEGVSMWDVRKPLKPVLRYGSEGPAQSCMNVRFNKAGTTLLALRRRLPPVLYAVDSATHLCQFDHPGYYNSCTMKSCCFAGNDDEYILSGSDDFNLYMWKIPSDDSIKWVDSAHMILRGHRSIVNQVRYNEVSCVLASSGVEKIIKLWSPFPLSQKCLGGLKRDDDREEKQRRVYTHDEYIGLVLRSGQLMTHDYSHQSTDEDQRMMAFFDSLVQREIESWSSEDVPTPQSPSEPENNNGTNRNNTSDSEDSTASDHRQLLRCFLGATINSHANPSTGPERPLESPNRITRLIANRREKLMRLASLDGGGHLKNSTASATATTANASATATNANAVESASASEIENNHALRNHRNKTNNILLRSKGVKRKNSNRVPSRRNRARRKQSSAKDDSDTEPEGPSNQQQSHTNNNFYHPVDSTQPSTSSGVTSSRRTRYTTTSLPVNSRRRKSRSSSSNSCSSSSSSSSSSCDRENNTVKTTNGNTDKPDLAKTESDSSTKEVKKTKISRTKSKTSVNYARRDSQRIKSKRQKVNNDIETSSNHNNNSNNNNNHRNSSRTSSKNAVLVHNGVADKQMVTPTKNSRNVASSDSGITSGISTTEKNGSTSTTEKSCIRSRAESSDRERTMKNLEWFKKKVDVARRGYRKRAMLSSPSSSDTSDE